MPDNLIPGAGKTSSPVLLNPTTFSDIDTFNTGGRLYVRFTGVVTGVGPLSDLLVSTVATSDGTVVVPKLSGSGGDFANVTDFLPETTATPHTTAAGQTFEFMLGLRGCCQAIKISAKGATGTYLSITAHGDNG